MKPRALDLFSGAGGATRGLQLAGFHVTGVDIRPQPRYVGDHFIQADALNPPFDVRSFDFIWASPPCQAFTIASKVHRNAGTVYPDLIEATRAMLRRSGTAWVIENVPGAPVRPDLILCGSQFGLPIARHRLFECSFPYFELLAPCNHARDIITICGHGTPQWMRKRRIARGLHPNASVAVKKAAIGVDWMNRGELAQSIPPAYSEFIGKAALNYIRQGRAA